MLKLLALMPYVRRHRWAVTGGFFALIMTSYFQLRVARVIGSALDVAKSKHPPAEVFAAFAALILGLTILQCIFRYLMRMWIVSASREIEFEFRNDLFTKFQALTPTFYDRERTGDLMSKATN